jgi:hypothetical protein
LKNVPVRRLLFITVPRRTSLKPVYVAIAAITLIALLGFAMALWPRGGAPSSYRPVREATGVSSRGPEDGLLIPSRPRELPGRTRRM